MGLFLCEICGQQLHLDQEVEDGRHHHACRPEDVKAHINWLKEEAIKSSSEIQSIRNAVYGVLQSLPTEEHDCERFLIEATWLEGLWQAAGCATDGNHRQPSTAQNHLLRFYALHRLMSAALGVFRNLNGLSTHKKLERLRQEAEKTAKALGYAGSMSLSVADVLATVDKPTEQS